MTVDGIPEIETGHSQAPSRVRLGPLQSAAPRRSRIPTGFALRWVSAFEQDGLPPAIPVFLTQPAYVRICSLAGRDLDNEVGGVLIGQWRQDPQTGEQFVVVEAALPARHTRQGSAFLTFTQDSLVALNDELEERYPAKRMVGWYHTHPRMGVFLSDYDVWLHRHFFPEPWQVALVVEPHSQIGGFFVRTTAGEFDPHRYRGFRELLGGGGRSLVYWRNIDPLRAAGE